MPNNALLAAADELERRGEALDGPEADFAVSREMAELAARLRHMARWLDRPPTHCRCAADASLVAATPAAKPLMLTSKEAAERLKLSTRTLSRLVDDGLLKPLKRGRYVRFAVAHIEEFARGSIPK